MLLSTCSVSQTTQRVATSYTCVVRLYEYKEICRANLILVRICQAARIVEITLLLILLIRNRPIMMIIL